LHDQQRHRCAVLDTFPVRLSPPVQDVAQAGPFRVLAALHRRDDAGGYDDVEGVVAADPAPFSAGEPGSAEGTDGAGFCFTTYLG
jgi:hypothetical protein